MNRIYNVIWSKAKNCYVVVSELVKSGGGKSGVTSTRNNTTFRAALCAFAITGCLVSGIAEANVVQGPGAAATGSNSVAVGDNAKSAGAKSVAVGNDATTLATSENGIAIGNGAKAEGQQRVKVPYPAGTIAIGQGSVAKENGDIVIGRQAKSTISKYHQQPGSGAVVMGAEAASYGSRGDVVIGAAAEANIIRKNATVDGDGQLFSQSVAIGSVAKVYGTQSVAIGGDVRSIGHSSIAIGGDDIDKAKPDLYKVIPDLAVPGTQKNFNREVAALHPSGLGTAGLNDSKNYVNTASIGNASLAIGMMTQSLGTGSNAIGANSLSKGVASSAIGAMARSWGNNSLAIGSQAGAYGEKSTSLGDANIVGFDMTNATLSGSAAGALGRGNKVYGNNAYAIGSENTVGSATVTETTESNGDKIKKVTAGTVKGNTAGAFGYKNTITTDNSYVVGSNSTISADNGMVLGNSATVTGANGLALGNNTKVANDNAVAIGNGSETAAAVATPSATINGVTHNFTGTNPASTVSVGKAGMERTVTNVAAGRISATSTDAINGSQLFAVKTEVEKGVSYAGDVKAAAATDNKFTRKLGEQTNIVGGVTDATKLTDNNIGVVSNGTDTLNIKLAKTLTGLDSVTAGGTTINNGGLTVDGKNYVSPNGINANNQKITNVADGTNSNDAVNYSQLQNAINSIDKVPTVKAKDANVTVTEGTNAAGGKEYTVGLGNTINVGTAHPVTVDGNAGHVTGLQNTDWNVANPVVVPGRAATEDQLKKVNDTVNTNKNQIDKNKQAIADNKQNITTNAGNIANNTQNIAKNAGDIVTINKTIEKGLNFDGDSGATINKKLGDTVAVKGGATGTLSDNNIGVVSDGTGTLNVKLAKTLTGLDSVTAGDTTINNGGLTVGGKNYVSPNGINANDQKITNVANGDVVANSKDAVNGGQLHQVKQDLGDQITNAKNDLNNKIDNTKTDLINKGLRFNADNDDEKTNKLGSKVTVNGDDNITTEITQTGDDTKIALKLKKDLNVRSVTATDTVKAGDVTMGKQADGANPGNTGNYITGLDNKTWDPGNVVSGRAATEDQLKQALANQTATGLKFDANVGGVQTSKLGSTVIVQGEGKAADSDYSGENIKTFIKQDAATGNTTIDVKMSKNLKAESVKVGKGDNKDGVSITGPDGANGTDGKVGITGKDGKDAVSMSGKDGIGHIGLNGKDGRSADISVEKGDPDIEGNEITRIKYQDENGKTHQVATKDDGMKYGGDSGAVINKKLNEQVNIIGGITDASKLTTEDNLGVVSDGSNNLKVRMAKDLKGLETVTTKDAAGNTTVVNGGGMKITPASGNPVSLTKDGLDNGGNKITNVAKGTAPTDAVNKSQLDQAAAAATTTVTAGDNIKVTPSDNPNGSKNYEVSLKDQVTLGSDPKKQIAIDGNAGTIKAGDKVEIDGDKGTIKVGKDGQDGVSITGPDAANGTDGKVGIAGKDGKDAVSMSGKDGVGHIGLNGKDGRSADISVEKGDPDIEGNEITRIKYQDENGKTHQVATKDDGMKYGGDSGAVINKKLNEQVNVIGGITDASKLTTEDNLGVVSDGTGNLKVRMAKELKGLETVTTKDAAGNTTVMNGGGVTITPASGNAVSLTKDGLNNGGNTITNVAAGVNGTDAVNVNQLKGATDKMANAINAVAGETQRVGAHAAAMAALKPIQYDPLEPTQVMAGVGNYRGETAAALGVAHYSAEDTMFHVGVSVGGHHNMVNAGVTHKFGNSDAKKAIPERYKGGPISSVYVLQDEVTALKAENARMQESLNELSSVKADNARMQQRIDELSSVKEDNEQMKAQIALLMQQAGLTK
ncbi:YadA-like family protein [Veillonella parvula]|uniref:ESPR-type extended signal peptide-containing protein n=1 Tax=Veillonella TaxID=29465 RepID=UPI000CF44928|nr:MULTISPECIES: ESPR-type extended signal peptide-containing protein [Veillonella]MCB6805037.1 YadA-like family protein [Veillonella parvula]MCQ4927499.1 YadA-like family protein [Veillonella parvula]MCQ4958688.1 YadA-like family protein [Veillonella parvula]PQL11835.1 hemagglutinin [Veillonella sp. S13054-11]